jgi:hypothetical protein
LPQPTKPRGSASANQFCCIVNQPKSTLPPVTRQNHSRPTRGQCCSRGLSRPLYRGLWGCRGR